MLDRQRYQDDLVTLLGVSPRKARIIVRAIFDVLSRALQEEDSIRITGLGVFKTVHRKKLRIGCVEYGGVEIVPPRIRALFYPAKNILRALNP